ncbi:hypothetical protein PM082_007459 [Marasmius tenuissimus]|nr:hypothetical protein PM082_007459 [Marasmius tenuissimus]
MLNPFSLSVKSDREARLQKSLFQQVATLAFVKSWRRNKFPNSQVSVSRSTLPDRPLVGRDGPMDSKRLCFPNVMTSWAAANVTARERTIPAIVNEIYDKSEWDRKVNDEAIVAKWKTEALGK